MDGSGAARVEGPRFVIWDLTYACPLRCIHCYSESGRRPSRQLDQAALLEITDRIIAAQPRTVIFSGGEPLLVEGLFAVAERLVSQGVRTYLYTSGQTLTAEMVPDIHRLFARVGVSLDGATDGVHDLIRGRGGSFARTLEALRLINDFAERARDDRFRFGIEMAVLKRNFADIERICTEIAPRFSALDFVRLSVCIPEGLASREGFEVELLDTEELQRFVAPSFREQLASLVPPGVAVEVDDQLELRLGPDDTRPQKPVEDLMLLAPDGEVRAFPIYEGSVGNLRTTPLAELWARVQAMRSHPELKRVLEGVRTMSDWAAATRKLDRQFGTSSDLVRIERRPPYRREDAFPQAE